MPLIETPTVKKTFGEVWTAFIKTGLANPEDKQMVERIFGAAYMMAIADMASASIQAASGGLSDQQAGQELANWIHAYKRQCDQMIGGTALSFAETLVQQKRSNN